MTETVLGFDFGLRKIGLAVGQSLTGTASPLPILPARDGVPDWQRIGNLVQTWQPNSLIVGLPLNMDGSTLELTERARRFARRLRGRFHLPVLMVDERLTSREAWNLSTRHGPVDSIAAVLIVEDFFRDGGVSPDSIGQDNPRPGDDK